MPARILVEVELDIHGKTLAELETELMQQLRAALGPAVQTELEQRARTVALVRCAACGRTRRRRGRKSG